MIADLEETLGMCLFERAKSGVRLTSDGKDFLPYAKKLMFDCDKLDEYVLSVKGINRGIIRIGTFSSVAAHWLPNIIRAYRKIGVVFKSQKTLSAAAKEFLKYLDFRNG